MTWWTWLLVAALVLAAAIAVLAVRAQRQRGSLTELLKLVPNYVLLLRDILRDPEVPRRAKVAPALVVIYLAIPIDLIPDFIPGLGQLDDALIVAWALRRLITAAGRERVSVHWRGEPETLERILRLARVR